MKKRWSAYIYVSLLACTVAIGGTYIWKSNLNQLQSSPQQVYYLDEYFTADAERSSDAHTVDEKDVVLEKSSEMISEDIVETVEIVQAEFILHLEDNHVTVYRCSDMSESYMATGIVAEDLPEGTLNEIIEGKEILDEEALYFFLESYSS